MGVEYVHYLISEDNTYKPRPDELSSLVDALVDSGFVFRTDVHNLKREIINTFGDDDPAVFDLVAARRRHQPSPLCQARRERTA